MAKENMNDSINRYVSVNRRILLRGWQGMPYALFDDISGHAVAVPEVVFRTLELCNGQFREKDPVFSGRRRAILRQLEKEGIIVFSETPQTMPPGQAYRTYPNHFIRKVQWALTGRCNYRCRHCFMSAPHAVLPQPGTQEMLNIADEIADCGIPVVTLTGGEPLIREDFLTIVERLVTRGVRISTIMTNGALVTDALLDSLEKLGIRCGFDISFDGVDGWHDWIRGVDGAGEKALQALRLCHARGFETGVQFTLHRGNRSVLRESIRLLSELGVSGAIIGGINDIGEAQNLREYILSPDELYEAYAEYLPQFVEDNMPLKQIVLSGTFEYQNGKIRVPHVRRDGNIDCSGELLCMSMRNSMYISPDGYALPCTPMSYIDSAKHCFSKISEIPLSEILGDSFYMKYICSTVSDFYEHNPECRTCEYKNLCAGGCRGQAVKASQGKNLMGKDLVSCRFFLDGYYARAQKLADKLQKVIDDSNV